jgi:hypothetical protein
MSFDHEYPSEGYFQEERARLDKKEAKIALVLNSLEGIDCRYFAVSTRVVSSMIRFWKSQLDLLDGEREYLELEYSKTPKGKHENYLDYASDLVRDLTKGI